MTRKSLLILSLASCLLCLFASGCDSLRFAPSQAQKKIAFQAHVTAREIEDRGTDAHSPASVQQVQATQAALSYIGLPADPVIEDYETTYARASADAARRPDANDVFASVEGGLSLAESLAALFGVGSLTLGGRSLVKWISLLRTKAKGMEEIVGGNELLVQWLKSNGQNDIVEAFKSFQRLKQKGSTPDLVALSRIGIKKTQPSNIPMPSVNNQSEPTES